MGEYSLYDSMRFLCKNLVFSLLLASGVMADSEIASPDGRIVLRAYTEDGPISYSVDFEGEPLIAKSGLGVELKQGGFMDAVVSNSQTRTSEGKSCLLYTSPSPRDLSTSRMPSSA